MGILNVTPDSFSDGGRWCTASAIQSQAQQMIAEGADILDIGGESTRPYAEPVETEEELRRVLPAIEQIRALSDIPISIDTTKAAVAQSAIAAGATMVNDISALRYDPQMVEVVAAYDGPVVIMHMQGTPGTMQNRPQYGNVVAEINAFFAERLAWMERRGIAPNRVILDPGIGFGKTLAHNLAILRNIESFKQHGCPVLVGHSRKSFFADLLDVPVAERDLATAVVSALCAQQGVDYLRVHAVYANVQAVTLAHTLMATNGDLKS